MADEQATLIRRCSSCKQQKTADQFTTAKTCQACAAKKEKGRRAGGQSKRRKGRATEGPPGTSWCAEKKWCPTEFFAAGNVTCNQCLQVSMERKAKARNTTAAAASGMEMHCCEAEAFAVHVTEPALVNLH